MSVCVCMFLSSLFPPPVFLFLVRGSNDGDVLGLLGPLRSSKGAGERCIVFPLVLTLPFQLPGEMRDIKEEGLEA